MAIKLYRLISIRLFSQGEGDFFNIISFVAAKRLGRVTFVSAKVTKTIFPGVTSLRDTLRGSRKVAFIQLADLPLLRFATDSKSGSNKGFTYSTFLSLLSVTHGKYPIR